VKYIKTITEHDEWTVFCFYTLLPFCWCWRCLGIWKCYN